VLARSIFTGLIEIGRGTQDTRRTAIFDELVPASVKSDSVEAIVRKLADARLITTDEVGGKDTITISHEKLIDAWPWLKKLVNENRDVIALQNEIAEDAKEWEEHQRDDSYLYSGARLATAQEKMKAQKIVLSGLAKEFIEQGIVLQEAEQKARESLRRKITAGLIAGIAIALVLAGFAGYKSVQANRQANIARAGELYALAFSQEDKDFSQTLLLNEEAQRKEGNSHTDYTILKLMHMNPLLDSFIFTQNGSISSIAFDLDHGLDQSILASGNEDGSIILWDVSDPYDPIKLSSLQKDNSPVNSVAFSPKGKLFVASNDDHTTIWDVSNPRNPIELNTLSEYSNFLSDVVFSPDDKLLALGSCGKFDEYKDCIEGTVFLWDVSNPKSPIKLATLSGNSSNVSSIAFSADGKEIASSSVEIILWDISTPTLPVKLSTFSGHTDYVTSVAFRPTGKELASGSLDSTVILWDVSNLNAPTKSHVLVGHSDYVTSVAYSPDGESLASASLDGSILIWDQYSIQNNNPRTLSSGDKNYVSNLVFSSDGKILASSAGHNSTILWDVNGSESVDDPRPWIQKSCQRAGRNFTREEWEQYFPKEDYRKTCQQWPGN
jgi:hypothetical protein